MKYHFNMHCYFCRHNTKEIDFIETEALKPFISLLGKIKARKKTGLCSRHQRQVSQAIKRARELALLPYTKK